MCILQNVNSASIKVTGGYTLIIVNEIDYERSILITIEYTLDDVHIIKINIVLTE